MCTRAAYLHRLPVSRCSAVPSLTGTRAEPAARNTFCALSTSGRGHRAAREPSLHTRTVGGAGTRAEAALEVNERANEEMNAVMVESESAAVGSEGEEAGREAAEGRDSEGREEGREEGPRDGEEWERDSTGGESSP